MSTNEGQRPITNADTITTAMVMAAGLGTRLRPHTNHRCKAMVKVNGRPLIDHMLDRLAQAGIATAIINVHAFADGLEAHLTARRDTGVGPDIIISDERDMLLETGGGVVKALPIINHMRMLKREGGDQEIGFGPILICNIDAVWTEEKPMLKSLMAAWDGAKMDELLCLTPTERTIGFAGAGDFCAADDQGNTNGENAFVIARPDRSIVGARGDYVYAGVQIFKPELAYGWPCEKFSRAKIWDVNLPKKTVYGHVMDGLWLHVGDPQALEVSNDLLAEIGSSD